MSKVVFDSFKEDEKITYFELLKRLDFSEIKNWKVESKDVLLGLPSNYLKKDEMIVKKEKLLNKVDTLYLYLSDTENVLTIIFNKDFNIIYIDVISKTWEDTENGYEYDIDDERFEGFLDDLSSIL